MNKKILTPYYRYHVFCCLNERPAGHSKGCCFSKSAQPLFNYFKSKVKEQGLEKIRINKAGCLDRCEEGPVIVIYPQGVWYRVRNQQDIDQIIDSHLIKGHLVKSLLLPTDQSE